jgi:exonuclease SbcC
MIRRITLQNYMSHTHTVIELADGLTVLVGPNNCGKSAVVSALETLCNNASGDYMVRHDEKEASITVETDDGHTVLWRRQGSAVSYIIDGREIGRLKRGVPDDLHKVLRLPKVDAGEAGEPFDIHFGVQKSPIFLLNEPESRAAVFFASSSDAATLLEMQKLHRNKVKERKNDEKRLKSEVEKLDAELAALEPLDALADSVNHAESNYDDLKGLKCQIQTFEKEIKALRAQSVIHDWLVQEYECLTGLTPPPQLADSCPLESLIDELRDAEFQLQRERSRSGALESLDSPPQPHDAQKLECLSRALSQGVEHHKRLKAKVDCLGLLNGPPATDDTGSLERMVDGLKSAAAANLVVGVLQRAFESLKPPPELADSEPLVIFIRQMEGAFRDLARHEASITEIAGDMPKLEAEVRAAERLSADRWLPRSADRRHRRRNMLALGGFAGISALIFLFLFTHGWLSRLNNSAPNRMPYQANPKGTALANAEDIRRTVKTSEPKRTPAKETPKKMLNEEPRTKEPMKDARDVTKQVRVEQVRQLLIDAEMASEKGKYLDSVLGYGQAALLYPNELPEVESPEKVRLKFVDALKRYQAEVERALQMASEQKTGK